MRKTVAGYHLQIWARHLHRLSSKWKPQDFCWLINKQIQEFKNHYHRKNKLKMKNEIADIISICYSALWFLGEKTAKQQDNFVIKRMANRHKGNVLSISKKYNGK